MKEFGFNSRAITSSEKNDKYQGIPKEVMDEVDLKIKEEFPEKDILGLCHRIWTFKKSYLKEKGYDWKSPEELNPDTIYD